jgi:hypothetical protein
MFIGLNKEKEGESEGKKDRELRLAKGDKN